MAVHTLNIPQIAQQATQPKGGPAEAGQKKTQPSKFDQALETTKSQASTRTHGVNEIQKAEKAAQTEKARSATQVTDPNKVQGKQKVETSLGVQKMFRDIEHGQNQMEAVLREAMSGRKFNPQELLALQAGVYRYAQELELASKVVEKATTGVKDTLKTQV